MILTVDIGNSNINFGVFLDNEIKFVARIATDRAKTEYEYAGAIANARIKKLVYACPEKTSGDNLCQMILQSERLNHKVEIEIDKKHQEECSNILSNFFKNKRKEKSMD